MSIYVESRIRASIEDVWAHTQDPSVHERWDLRFSSIRYLPKEDPGDPQRFLYATRIGFGLRIEGAGESTGTHEGDGSRTSALRFWSDDRKSLIREGSGYWRYVETGDGLRFLTRYDYRVRWGAPGRMLDRACFRPLLGWATAWSFDCMRLWIEKGIAPEVSKQRALVHALARAGVAFVWLWHGLVPKLVFRHPDEVLMLTDAGIPARTADALAIAAGVAEIAAGIVVLATWRQRWPLVLTLVVMALATAGVLVHSPRYFTAAFNPATLNALVAVLATIGLLTLRDLPSAARCLRVEPEGS